MVVMAPVVALVSTAVVAAVLGAIMARCNVANTALAVSTMATVSAMNVVARVVSVTTMDVARIA